MKSFGGSIEDLGGTGANGNGTLKDGSPARRDEGGNGTAVAAACGSMGGRLAIDCSLARALAEGRLGCKASCEVRRGQDRSKRLWL